MSTTETTPATEEKVLDEDVPQVLEPQSEANVCSICTCFARAGKATCTFARTQTQWRQFEKLTNELRSHLTELVGMEGTCSSVRILKNEKGEQTIIFCVFFQSRREEQKKGEEAAQKLRREVLLKFTFLRGFREKSIRIEESHKAHLQAVCFELCKDRKNVCMKFLQLSKKFESAFLRLKNAEYEKANVKRNIKVCLQFKFVVDRMKNDVEQNHLLVNEMLFESL